MRKRVFLTLTGAVAATLMVAMLAPVNAPAREAMPPGSFQRPLSFEPNVGQTHPSVLFLARGPQPMWIMGDSATLGVGQKGAVRMKWVGGNPKPASAKGLDPLPSKANYFIGSDPKGWHTDVPNYGKVRLEEVYPGIGLLFHPSADRKLEYDFEVAPGADPTRIAIEFEGARKLSLEPNGDLRIETEAGDVIQHKPVAFQGPDPVTAAYELRGNGRVRFALGSYDRARPLVIDPTLEVSRFYGGNQTEEVKDMEVDGAGSTYITGYTNSPNLPIIGTAYQTTIAQWPDAYVAKFSVAGVLQYSTYLGGSGAPGAVDIGEDIAVDGNQNAYLVVNTTTPNFPIVNCGPVPPPASPGGYKVKLNSTATSLLYSCPSNAIDVAVTSAGLPYWLHGYTSQYCVVKGDPTAPLILGCQDSTSNGLGGIALDPTGGVWVASQVSAPTNGGDILVRKRGGQPNPQCETCVHYSATFGGSSVDRALDIRVDATGKAFVVGETQSTNLPGASNSYQGGYSDGFVARFGIGTATTSAYVGGNDEDRLTSIRIRTTFFGSILYAAGVTESANFPASGGIGGPCVAGQPMPMVWASFSGFSGCVGSTASTSGPRIGLSVVGALFRVHIAGHTSSTTLQPPTNMQQFSNAGQNDAWLVIYRE